MRKNILTLLVICCFLAFANPGLSLTIDSGATDVGEQDLLYAQTTLSVPSYENELAWVQSVLGSDYYFAESDGYDVYAIDWEVVDGSTDFFALDLQGEPEYYFIKIGTGALSPPPNTHYLYVNLDELAWAVISLSGIYEGSKFDIGRVSHIGEVGSTPVPEPSTILLLGAGLVGLGVLGRKFRTKP